MRELFASRYSYYERTGTDWQQVFRTAKSELTSGLPARSWMRAVARVLAPAQDIHLRLSYRGSSMSTAQMRVDPLYRKDLLERYFTIDRVGPQLLHGSDHEAVHYLMIGAWNGSVDLKAVDRVLAEVRDQGKAVILDVRPNGGGSELLARHVAQWFVKGSKVYARHRIRKEAGKNGFGLRVDRRITEWTDRERRLEIPVALLIGPGIVSSNDAFVLMMRQARDCVLVGQRSFGSSGNPQEHPLANQVSVFLPSWLAFEADNKNSFEGVGIAPDVEVEVGPDELSQRDPILERALALLRAKLR